MQQINQNNFEGHAFHKGFPSGKSSGNISLNEVSLTFEGGGKKVHLPLDGLKMEHGGAANRLLFFTHSSYPDWSIYTGDKSILKNPILHTQTHLSSQTKGIKRKRRIGFGISFGVVAFIILIFASLFFLRDPIAQQVANQIPFKWEEKIGETLFSSVQSQSKIIRDDHILEDLKILTTPLVNAIKTIHGETYNFKFYIAENETINAFAMPGGYIVIHTELILKADSAEEVLGVVAHEIAHVTRRHVLKQMVSTLGTYILVDALLGDMTGILAVIADNSTLLLSQKFSRDYEREADNFGWKYLLKANINPRGMIDFFYKLKNETEKENKTLSQIEQALSILSTHPATQERIDYLKEKEKKLQKNLKFFDFPLDFENFKDKIKLVITQKN